MTEKLTIKDLNCGNCTNHRLVGRVPDIDDCAVMDHMPTRAEIAFIEKWGCIHNPLALQVLAAPVIEELQARNDNVTYPIFVSDWGMSKGRQEAIKLLKEGVKKL